LEYKNNKDIPESSRADSSIKSETSRIMSVKMVSKQ